MFAGVGPYSILTAKLQPNARVNSSDINPAAIQYLKENILMNGSADRVIPLLGDVREFSRGMLSNAADRVIMNLPSEAKNYLDAALQILKYTGGIIHFYEFVPRATSLDEVKEEFKASVQAQRREVRSFDYVNAIREVAPNKVQVAVDARIQ
jgi:tRNA (guanine37-N1)-methyltransferase